MTKLLTVYTIIMKLSERRVTKLEHGLPPSRQGQWLTHILWPATVNTTINWTV